MVLKLPTCTSVISPVVLVMLFNEWGVTDQSFIERPNKAGLLIFSSHKTAPQAPLLVSLRSFPHSQEPQVQETEGGLHFLGAKVTANSASGQSDFKIEADHSSFWGSFIIIILV